MIDNDLEPTASSVAASARFPCPVRYVHEPQPGLTAARNRALDETTSDVLVFIDDDEWALDGWPDGLIRTMVDTGAALVGGPVRTVHPPDTPRWIVDGGFFDRAEPATGTPQRWLRTGNLAIDMTKIRQHDLRFDQRFARTGGEDVDFSRRAAKLGLGLQWNDAAVVMEEVPPDRITIEWLSGRERRSTANWVRAELLLEPSGRTRLVVALRGLVRFGQGAITSLIALPRRDVIGRHRGRILRARGMGSWDGILARAAPAYGDGVDDQG